MYKKIIYIYKNNIYVLPVGIKGFFNKINISVWKLACEIDGLTIDGNDIAEIFN